MELALSHPVLVLYGLPRSPLLHISIVFGSIWIFRHSSFLGLLQFDTGVMEAFHSFEQLLLVVFCWILLVREYHQLSDVVGKRREFGVLRRE